MSTIEEDCSDTASVRSDDSLRFLAVQIRGDTEELEKYRKGGFHPVHLGDLYDGGRYRIVHKLGAGGFATVWLAHDSLLSTWVALKIVTAHKSALVEEKATMCHNLVSDWNDDRFMTYKRLFHIEGPNGRHLCLVLPLCGPSCYQLSQYLQSRIHGWLARHVAAQAAGILSELHSRGLCHGDLTPSNLVFRIRNLDHLDDQGIYSLFGEPTTGVLETAAGDIPGPEAPRYIVGYLDFMSSHEDVVIDEVCLIDIDQVFLASAPPGQALGIPIGFLAPEVAVGKPAGPASDVWALGCTILHIRSGSSPFESMSVDCPANLIPYIMEYIGDIPASWGEPLSDKDGQPTNDQVRGQPMEEYLPQAKSLKEWVSNIWDQPSNGDPRPASSSMVVRHDNRPYPKSYDTRFWKPAAIRMGDIYLSGYCEEVDEIIESLPKIPSTEVDLLSDLMSAIFVYEPGQRVTASDILAHPWFQVESKQ